MTNLELVSPLSGWALPLSGVPDPVFASGMAGNGIAIDPTGDTLYAPCDGHIASVHPAGHAVAIDTAAGIRLLIHLGINTVQLGGAPFTSLVTAGAEVRAGQPLVRFDLDAIVCGASSAVTPVLAIEPEGTIISGCRAEGPIAVGDPLYRVVVGTTRTPDAPTEDAGSGETLRHAMTVGLPHGLHARPAARIVAAAREHGAKIVLHHGDAHAVAASPLSLLALGLSHGAPVEIEATGSGAAAAIAAVIPLLTKEMDGPPSAPTRPTATSVSTRADPDALVGVAAAPGLAIGTAFRLRDAQPDVPQQGAGIEAEGARLTTALSRVATELDAGASKGGQTSAVLSAHRAILDDPDLIADARREIERGASAGAAILAAATAQAERLSVSGNARIAERADDIRDVAYRVVHAILGTTPERPDLPESAMLIAEELLPSQLAAIDPARLAGIALVGGGPTSHVAILAAGMGVPMVVALGDTLDGVVDGEPVAIDGDAGWLYASPSPDRMARVEMEIERREIAEAEARAAGDRPTATADGTSVSVYANLGSIDDAVAAAAAGAEGCGLLRTEFLFLRRAAPPAPAEQIAEYDRIVKALRGKPVVIRLLDVGGDKPAPYLDLPAEENPALGVRGIRVSLARPELLETQLRAILSVPDRGACRIMVPMVSSAGELQAVRTVLDRLLAELGGSPVQLGAMVETPAAAATADLIATQADFLSIGSNDLTQYVLAMDRGNPALAGTIDGLHPAVLRLIGQTCDSAAESGIPVSVCGGLAADPLAVAILVGLGVRTLSVPPARIAATKAIVAKLDLAKARRHAKAALAQIDAAAVRALARSFMEEIR